MTLTEQTVINDCYILQSRIGEDAFTEHWLATVIFNATVFLLRFVKPEAAGEEFVTRLRRVTMDGYRVHEAGLSDIVEIERWNDRVFLSSEWTALKPLLSVLGPGELFSVDAVCGHGIRLAFALKAFHDSGLVFGGLNSECVYGGAESVGESRWKILKPGLLPLMAANLPDSPALRDAWACVAPEIKNGQAGTPRSDIYSLGIILVRLLDGRLPFPETGPLPSRDPVPLRFVAGSLSRRKVPEPLIRITLGMLMHEPARRYASLEAVIRDFKRVIAGKSGGFPGERDALALAVKPPVRAFDTSDYFESIAGKSGTIDYDSGLSYPLSSPPDSKEDDALVNAELRVLPEEARWEIGDYIEYGISTVTGVPARIPDRMPKVTAEPERLIPEARLESVASPVPSVEPPLVAVSPVTAKTPSHASSPEPERKPPETARAVITPPEHNPKADAIREALIGTAIPDIKPIVDQVISSTEDAQDAWSYHRVLTDDIAAIFRFSLTYAKRGKGSFRWLQEPVSDYTERHFYGSVGDDRAASVFLDVGSFAHFGTASPSDFLAMVRKAGIHFVQSLSSARKGALRRRLAAAGFATLFDPDAPDPEHVGDAIVSGLCAVGTRTSPLVFVVRGGERIDRDLHDLLMRLAHRLHASPLAVTVFFDYRDFPPWHTLNLISNLRKPYGRNLRTLP